MTATRERLTVSNAVKILTAAVHTPATGGRYTHATIAVEAQPLRYTIDGTDPVASTTGIKLVDGDIIELQGVDEIAAFKAIRDGGTDSTIEVIYQRP